MVEEQRPSEVGDIFSSIALFYYVARGGTHFAGAERHLKRRFSASEVKNGGLENSLPFPKQASDPL